MKILHEREKCIGCGSCAAICPKFWEMANDGKVTLIGSKLNSEKKHELEVDSLSCLQESADSCPVEIIHVIKK